MASWGVACLVCRCLLMLLKAFDDGRWIVGANGWSFGWPGGGVYVADGPMYGCSGGRVGACIPSMGRMAVQVAGWWCVCR